MSATRQHAAATMRARVPRGPARGKSGGVTGRFGPALLVLAVTLAALAATTTARPVAAATPVTVRLTIQQVVADDCFEGSEPFGGCLGAPDFYAKASVNNGPLTESDTRGDDFDPAPAWQFTANVDWDTTQSVPLRIEIWDDDDTFRVGDDRADISPVDGATDLDLTLTLGRVPCTFAGSGVNGTCSLPVDIAGGGQDGDGEARIIFRIDVINNLTDADGDGIPDGWEQNGVTLNGQFIDLPAMGADPNRPDIFIQIDWMQNATRNQALSNGAIQQVVNAFANAPYVSPTGSTGINLHVDQGPGSTRDFTTGATWGSLSRAQSIPFQNNLGTLTNGQYDWTQFQVIKSANFEPTGRSPIFHYVIAANFLQPPPPPAPPAPPVPQNTSSGISRNDDNQFTGGTSDFIISLGGFGCPTNCGAGTQQQQAGTLMHELGHNLGLQHGGGDSVNYKANYLSVMNYLFQFRGLDVGPNAGVLDYSRAALPPVNEGQLNENNALGLPGFGTGSRCPLPAPPPGRFTNQYTVNANGPFNWNCTAPTNGVVSFDANSNGGIDGSLAGFNDWPAIVFRGGQIGQLGAAPLPTLTDQEPEIPWDQAPPSTIAEVAPAPTGHGWNKSAVTVTLRATDNPGGFGLRDITYSATGAQPLTSTTVLGDVASFVIGAEGETTVTFTGRDQALNVEAARTLVVRVDLTDPTISLGAAYPAPNAAGWNNTDVNVPFTAADVPSGIASTVPPSSPLVLTAEGTAVTGTITAVDRADRVATAMTPAFKIDKTPPSITVTSPTPNQAFDSDQTMTPQFGATDTLSGLKSVVAVLDTGQVVTSGQPISLGLLVGKRTLTVTATDVADNVATVVVPFRVRPVFTGVAYTDANDGGMREMGEDSLPGVTVFLDNNGNGRSDAGEPSAVTSGSGAYRVVGEDVGPARLCTLPVTGDRVRTTSRCQTVIVATGIAVPHVDFGSRPRVAGCTGGGVASVIQSMALAGRPDEYWRPAALAGTATGPWAGSRLVVRNGGANPAVQVQTGERVATGLFVGGVDAAQVSNLALQVQYQPNHQRIVAIVAADGTSAVPTTAPTTAFSYAVSGNILTIYGVPQDGLGGYQDIWLVTEITDNAGNVTTTAGIAGTVTSASGEDRLQPFGNTCNDTSQGDLVGGMGGTLPGALRVDDIPDHGTTNNPH